MKYYQRHQGLHKYEPTEPEKMKIRKTTPAKKQQSGKYGIRSLVLLKILGNIIWFLIQFFSVKVPTDIITRLFVDTS